MCSESLSDRLYSQHPHGQPTISGNPKRNTLGKNVIGDGEKTIKGDDIQDPGKLYDAAKKLSPMLVTRSTLVPVSAAALLPFLAIGLTQLPMKVSWASILKRLLLL